MCTVTLAVGDKDKKRGVIIGPWYGEALRTGIAQIARGVFEAFVPYGKIANAVFGVMATVNNIEHNSTASGSAGLDENTPSGGYEPHQNPKYPFPFQLLYLV
jgi:hypothetical protein